MDGLFGAKVDCKSPEGMTREQPHSVGPCPYVLFLLKSGSAELAWNEPGSRRSRPTTRF